MPGLYEEESDEAPPQEMMPDEAKEDGGQTGMFLMNKEAAPNLKPGAEFRAKCVKDHGEELECQMVEGEDEQEEQMQPEAEPEMATEPGMMD